MSSKRSLLRILEREREAHAAERQRLIDTICHLAGRPWNVPPADLALDRDTDMEPTEPALIHADHWPE